MPIFASGPAVKAKAARAASPGERPPGHGSRERAAATARYLMTTEVHTFAFSVAANSILSFFPFIVLLLTLIRKVFHSPAMHAVVVQLLQDYLPANQGFVIRNLNALVNARKGVQIASILILLVTSSGVFLPMEVALNKIWGFRRNRSYLGNQVISLGLAFACGVLALVAIALPAGNQRLLQIATGSGAAVSEQNTLVRAVGFVIMKMFAIGASVGIFFLIYWLLPNGKVRPLAVLPAAVIAGLFWEAAKYAYILALQWLNFQDVYGPFSISVTLMFWAFLSGLIVLGGAHLSAQPSSDTQDVAAAV